MTDDRLLREGSPPSGQLASPVPQYWDPDANGGKGDWRKVEGAHGAPRAILYGPNGQPIGSSNPLPVADSALAQAVAQLATEGKLEEARALLETISQKDFATQTTLSEVLQRLEAIEEQLETGDAKVQLKGHNVEILRLRPDVITTTLAPGEFFETVVDMQGFTQWWFQSYVAPTASQIIRVTFSDREGNFSTTGYVYLDEWQTGTDGKGEELRYRASGNYIALATPQLVRARWMRIRLINGGSVDAQWRNFSIVRVKGGIAHG